MKKFIGEVAESYIARRLAILYKNILAESLYHGNNKYKYILYLYKQFHRIEQDSNKIVLLEIM